MSVGQEEIKLMVCKKIANKFSKKLSHYTKQDVLLSILENKQFWFGNAKLMNDKTELSYFIKKLENAIYEDCLEENREKAENLFKEIYGRLGNEYPYAMCFSETEDDAAQWERYGDNAHGICIVFNTEKLLQLIYGSELYLAPVYYDNDIRKHQHFQYVMNYLKDEPYGFEDSIGLIDNIIATAASYKHRSFEAEKESRICTIMIRNSKFYKEVVKKINGFVKTFLIVNVGEFENDNGIKIEDTIDKIYIGPRSIQDEDELKKYLKQIGYECLQSKILKSDCPLR